MIVTENKFAIANSEALCDLFFCIKAVGLYKPVEPRVLHDSCISLFHSFIHSNKTISSLKMH